MKRALVCAILLAMPVRSAAPSQAQRLAAGSRLAENARVRAALEWLDHNLSWINDTQVRLTEIPAPPFQEEARAAAFSMSGYDENDYYGFGGSGSTLGPAVPLDEFGYDDYR